MTYELDDIVEHLNKLKDAGFRPVKIYLSKQLDRKLDNALLITVPSTVPDFKHLKTRPRSKTIQGIPCAVTNDDTDTESFAVIVTPDATLN